MSNNLLLRRRMLMQAGGSPTPPTPYQQIEFLESSGTQWIDLGIPVRQYMLPEFEYQFTNTNYYNWVFGQVAGNGWACLGYRARTIWWFTSTTISVVNTSKHQVEYKDDGAVYYDGNVIAHRGNSFASQAYTILLFAERNDGGTINKGSVRIYNFKIKESGSNTIDLIPVRVGTTGYMYDAVSGNLFGNAGSGDFIVGPDIN